MNLYETFSTRVSRVSSRQMIIRGVLSVNFCKTRLLNTFFFGWFFYFYNSSKYTYNVRSSMDFAHNFFSKATTVNRCFRTRNNRTKNSLLASLGDRLPSRRIFFSQNTTCEFKTANVQTQFGAREIVRSPSPADISLVDDSAGRRWAMIVSGRVKIFRKTIYRTLIDFALARKTPKSKRNQTAINRLRHTRPYVCVDH